MGEVLFYHLERQPLEAVLPTLIEKTLERGWRALVRCGSEERQEALDAVLWTYRPDSFLPHGTARDGHAADQPVFLTTEDENPNGAGICFLVDGVEPQGFDGFARTVILFDGRQPEAVARARAVWSAAKAAGASVTYWQQDDAGRWGKK